MHLLPPTKSTFSAWVELALELWPQATRQELAQEFRAQLKPLKYKKYQTYLCENAQGQAIAFISLFFSSFWAPRLCRRLFF